jgi:hypothetical protein
MNTNRFLVAPPRPTKRRLRESPKLFWAAISVFTGLLLAVLYCLLTHQVPI